MSHQTPTTCTLWLSRIFQTWIMLDLRDNRLPTLYYVFQIKLQYLWTSLVGIVDNNRKTHFLIDLHIQKFLGVEKRRHLPDSCSGSITHCFWTPISHCSCDRWLAATLWTHHTNLDNFFFGIYWRRCPHCHDVFHKFFLHWIKDSSTIIA